jgi:hypothetical protein
MQQIFHGADDMDTGLTMTCSVNGETFLISLPGPSKGNEFRSHSEGIRFELGWLTSCPE